MATKKKTSPAPPKPPPPAACTITLKKGAPFKAVGIADFTLFQGQTREVSKEIAASIDGLFRAGALPAILREYVVVEGI